MSFVFITAHYSIAQSNDSLLVYTTKMDSLYIDISKYDYVLVFMCESCMRPIPKKIKQKSKILLIPLVNDITYKGRVQTKLYLKRDYPASDCYFLDCEEKKRVIVQRFPKNELVKVNK